MAERKYYLISLLKITNLKAHLFCTQAQINTAKSLPNVALKLMAPEQKLE
jgi:hypothetical protein